MNTIPILMYHSLDSSGSVLSVSRRDFANQLACLSAKGFRGISLNEAVTHREREGVWPEQRVVITFDDGFANVYDQALPELSNYGFTATVFIVTGHMGGRNDWNEEPARRLGCLPLLSWKQAAELAATGIEIGSHTQTHCDLRSCSTEEANNEISRSVADIENRLGLRAQSFAYPYGGTNLISRRLTAKYFRASCTTELRRANSDALDALPRVDMHYVRSPLLFAGLLEGKLDQYLAVRRLGRRARRVFMSDSRNI